jgi:ABC-type lipoprotein export system ATPase subunit
LINIKDLEFRYPRGEFRLRLAALDIQDQERVAVVGASGSGKTTLLDLIAGIRQPGAGAIEVAGQDLALLTDRQRRGFRVRRIGLIFQAFELLDYLTVRDNILLPYRISPDLELADDTALRLDQLARDMGIIERLDRFTHELSQGERQRVAICRALITAPDLILADEPTGNLDPDNKQRVLRLLLAQVERHAATLVMVTHDHDLLAPFDRVLDMRELHGATNA